MGQGNTPWRVYFYAAVVLVMAMVISSACIYVVGDIIMDLLGPMFGIVGLFFVTAVMGVAGMFLGTYLFFVRGRVQGMTFKMSVQHPEHRVFYAYLGNLPTAFAGIILFLMMGMVHRQLGNTLISLSTVFINAALAVYAIWRAMSGARAISAALDR